MVRVLGGECSIKIGSTCGDEKALIAFSRPIIFLNTDVSTQPEPIVKVFASSLPFIGERPV